MSLILFYKASFYRPMTSVILKLLKVKDFFGFASAALGSSVLTLSLTCDLYAQNQENTVAPAPNSESLSSAKEDSEELNRLAELPQWILEKPMSLRSRLVLELDGSEQANDLSGRSETIDRVEYRDPENWRMLRQLPFLFERQEFVCKKSVVFKASLSNKLHVPRKEIASDAWVEVFLFPFLVSQDWNYLSDSSSWEDWLKKMIGQKEAFENAIGDRIEVTVKEEESFKTLEIRMTGTYKHEGTTNTNFDLEWRLEYEKDPQLIVLDESLMVGGTAS